MLGNEPCHSKANEYGGKFHPIETMALVAFEQYNGGYMQENTDEYSRYHWSKRG